jgi:hypothetical protein
VNQPQNISGQKEVTVTVRYPAGNFFQVPNGIHRAVNSPYDLSVLIFLMQCADRNGKCFPSYATISQGIMSRYQAIKSVKNLHDKGIVNIERIPYKTNTFIVDFHKLVNLIDQSTTLTSQSHRLHRSTTLTTPINQVDSNNTQITKPSEQEDKNNISLIDAIYSEVTK